MLNLCDSKRIYVYNFVITATVVLGDQKSRNLKSIFVIL